MGEESTRVTVRLPIGMVRELDEMIIKGKYRNMSEAIADCIRSYLKSEPEIEGTAVEKQIDIKMESLITEEVTMDELIRDAAKKFTKEKINNER